MVVEIAPPRSGARLTLAEFEALPESTLPTELIDGELVMSPTPQEDHQTLSIRLLLLIGTQLATGRLYHTFDVYLDEGNVVQPDVLWVAPERTAIIHKRGVMGAPDLAVEILSPGSVRRDRVTKHALYERFGVREYWLADPANRTLEAFTLHDGRFQPLGIFEQGDAFTSPLLGLTIDLSALFREP